MHGIPAMAIQIRELILVLGQIHVNNWEAGFEYFLFPQMYLKLCTLPKTTGLTWGGPAQCIQLIDLRYGSLGSFISATGIYLRW
jgi:hypothetical protein